jgi:hypothetical protein
MFVIMSSFDLKTFENIKSFKKRYIYAKEHLKRLGAGSSRIVFELNDKFVLKIARNMKGIAQNEFECSLMNDYMAPDFLTKVKDCDDKSFYIIAEKAKPMTKTIWRRITGFEFDDFAKCIVNIAMEHRGAKRYINRFVDPDIQEKIEETEFFSEVMEFIGNFNMMPGDFGRISSWGLVNRNGTDIPVLLDYGVNEDVFTNFYKKPRQF